MHPLRRQTGGCPLCASSTDVFAEDKARRYYRCVCCMLVFADPASRPARDVERRHYDCHQNDPADHRYRWFLSRLFQPLNAHLKPRSCGLDFGSGPGPTLSRMLAEAGHRVHIYDPIYAPDRAVLQRRYDFVTASEVVEHFHHPAHSLSLIWSLLRVGGWLGIMTKRVQDAAAFQTWHYKQDPTHVSFFSVETFNWLADRLQATLTVVGDDVVLLQKRSDSARRGRPW